MHHISFLQDLAVVLIVAAVVTVVFRQLRQPVVLGYIIAGVIIGPHTPPFPLILNPGADEELRVGDRLLLLGNGTQLDKAIAELRLEREPSAATPHVPA